MSRINNRSKKQHAIERKLAKIKEGLIGSICPICRQRYGTDLMHLLPRSTFPEYITEEWNLVLGCRPCHVKFDEDKEFRRSTGLGEHIKEIDELAYNRYYVS